MGHEPGVFLPALVDALGWTLLDFVWQGAAIAGLYALARALLRAVPRARLWTGYLALVTMALAPMLTLLRRWPNQAEPETAAMPLQASIEVLAGGAAADGLALHGVLPWLVAGWCAGVLVLGARAWLQWRSLRRICAAAEPVDAQWQETFQRLCTQLRINRSVRLLRSAHVLVPMLIGWLRPVILLPAGLCLRLPTEQVELLLAHELAHVRRWDFLANLLQVVLETVLFYHPAVHWVSRCVREDRELCCDDLVAELAPRRIDYARALLAAAEERSRATPTFALAATGGALLMRVEHIVGARAEKRQRRYGRAPLLVLIVAAITGWAWSASQPSAVPSAPALAPLSLEFSDALLPVARLVVADWRPQPVAALVPLVASPPVPAPVLPALEARRGAPVEEDAQIAQAELMEVALAGAALEPVAMSAPMIVPEPSSAQAGLRALHTVAPDYPRVARMHGVEGSVELSFRIDSSGRPAAITVENATPSNVFDVAARRALEQWRFPASAAGSVRLHQAFEFRLTPAESRAAAERCVAATGTRICRSPYFSHHSVLAPRLPAGRGSGRR